MLRSIHSKKAALNLSINAIVVVVLAFVMLGLGLTLTRSIFSNIGETQGQISEQIRQQVLDDLRTGDKPLSFPQTEVDVELNDRQNIAFGLKNTGSTNSWYCGEITALISDPATQDVADADAIRFVYDQEAQALSPQGTVVVPVSVGSAPTQGLYKGKIEIWETQSEIFDCPTTYAGADWKKYAQKSFFINII